MTYYYTIYEEQLHGSIVYTNDTNSTLSMADLPSNSANRFFRSEMQPAIENVSFVSFAQTIEPLGSSSQFSTDTRIISYYFLCHVSTQSIEKMILLVHVPEKILFLLHLDHFSRKKADLLLLVELESKGLVQDLLDIHQQIEHYS